MIVKSTFSFVLKQKKQKFKATFLFPRFSKICRFTPNQPLLANSSTSPFGCFSIFSCIGNCGCILKSCGYKKMPRAASLYLNSQNSVGRFIAIALCNSRSIMRDCRKMKRCLSEAKSEIREFQ